MQTKLQERTVLLRGPVTSVNRSIASALVEAGADVILADSDIQMHQRTVEQLQELRETSRNCGRAASLQLNGSHQEEIQECISRSTEFFGGIDIYIDSPSFLRHQPLGQTSDLEQQFKIMTTQYLHIPICITQILLNQFQQRKRGRILYLHQEVCKLALGGAALESAARSGLNQFASVLAREAMLPNFTVNCVGYGLVEEYLLANYPGMTIREAESTLKQQLSLAKLTSVDKIANVVTFLVSALGAGVNGQSMSATDTPYVPT